MRRHHRAQIAVGLRNVSAARSTSAGGGVSLTNRRASFVEMNRAVEGCVRENVEHLFAVVLAAARLDSVTEHDLLALVVQLRHEAEAAALARVRDRPAGERARDFGDVLLRVAAVDAERVQLEQLAPVVLVQSLRRVRPLLRRLLVGARRRREPSEPRTSRRAVRTDWSSAGRLDAVRSDPRSSSCPDRRASPGSSPSRRADRGSGRARAVGSRRARTRSA